MQTIPLSSDHMMLRALPPSVSTARRFVRRALTAFGHEQISDDAELIASELVTNSINAAGAGVSWVTVSVHAHPAHVLLEVWDSCPGVPVFGHAAADDTSGRGLAIVEELSRRWGCRWPRTGGKTVWAEIALNDSTDP